MLMRTNFTLFWTYSRKSNENLCKGLLTCTSFYCDRKQWVWQLFNKLASQQHGLYIIPKHYINCGIQARWSRACVVIFHGSGVIVITCSHFGICMGASRFQKQFPIKISKFHAFFFKWSQIWQKGWHTLTCQMMFSCIPTNLVWNFQKKIMQKLKLRVPFVKHRPYIIPFSIKQSTWWLYDGTSQL